MGLDLGALDSTRYLSHTKALLAEFFSYYLLEADDCPEGAAVAYKDRWSTIMRELPRVQTVRSLRVPANGLQYPLICLGKGSEEVTYTNVARAQYERWGEWHTLAYQMFAITDDRQGGELAVDDLSAALNVVVAEHRAELDAIGIRVVRLQDQGEADGDHEDGLYINQHEFMVEVLLTGAKLRTIPVEMGFFQVTAESTGTFSQGQVLELPQNIYLETAYGTRPPGATVTVQATNQDGDACILTALVPGATERGARVEFEVPDADDLYTAVTDMSVVGGTAGDRYRVLNESMDLTEEG